MCIGGEHDTLPAFLHCLQEEVLALQGIGIKVQLDCHPVLNNAVGIITAASLILLTSALRSGAVGKNNRQGMQRRSERRSVIKPCPGACVIISLVPEAMAACCGVTPQAQNTQILSRGISITGGP